MTLLWEIAREAIALLPGEPGEEVLGRVVTPSSITTTTVVSTSALAFGGLTEQAYAQKWMWRPACASVADCIRYSTEFAPATGTVTHAGTNYSDTTVGSESLILTPWYPGAWRTAIDMGVRRIREKVTTIVPVSLSQRNHYIHDLPWLTGPGDIIDVEYSNCPVITRNRYFQERYTVNSSGVQTPDFWTVANNAAASPFVATNYRNQKWYYSLERSGGTDATMTQTVSAMQNGVEGAFPAGSTITAVCVADPDTAGDVLLSLSDGTTTATSTGSGAALQEITTSLTLADAAQEITITVTAQTSNAAQKIYEAYVLVGDIVDGVRYDSYDRYPVKRSDYEFVQGGPLQIRTPFLGVPGQLIIHSERGHTGFDATRLQSGAADTDNTDADLTTAATGAIYYLFRGKYGPGSPLTMEWEKRFDQLRAQRIAYKHKDDGGGFRLMGSPLTAPARRGR
jgi:hypothetical protein